eukprot:767424-Rhodomonas_salina.3
MSVPGIARPITCLRRSSRLLFKFPEVHLVAAYPASVPDIWYRARRLIGGRYGSEDVDCGLSAACTRCVRLCERCEIKCDKAHSQYKAYGKRT